MQEINLLQNKVKDRTLQFERSNKIVLVLFGLILVLEIAGTAGLYLLVNSSNDNVKKINAENVQIQNQMDSDRQTLTAAQGLQAQLKNVTTLLNNHVYWTEFFNQVSSIVPAKVQFNSLTSSVADDKLHVEGTAQSYQDIGRLLLALNANNKFRNVKLHSVVPSQNQQFGYAFSIDLAVTPNIFKTQTK